MAQLLDVLLLTLTDFTDYRDISPNTDAERLNVYIRESQVRELRTFLGDELYLKLILDYDETTNTFTDQRYTDIYFGVDYVNGTKTIRFNGLKGAHVLNAYKRFLDNQSINVTRYGVKDLTSAESESTTQAQIRTKKIDAESMAKMYESDAKRFLSAKAVDYPEYDNGETPLKNTSFNFIKVSN